MIALAPLQRTPLEAAILAAADGEAASRFAAAGLPHRRLEAWKWTDLRAALREPLEIGATADASTASPFAAIDPFAIVLGHGAATWRGDPPKGVALAEEDAGQLLAPIADHPMALAAAATTRRILRIRIEAGAAVERPLLLAFRGAAGQLHARVIVELGERAEAVFLEDLAAAGPSLMNATFEARLAAGAALQRYVVQTGEAGAAAVSTAGLVLGKGARFAQTGLYFGAKAGRFETRILCAGDGADVSLRSACALSDRLHADVTTHVAHEATGCRTRQTHKSALRGRSRGVFQGKFLVARGAQKTDAQMRANALLLSEDAEANHKPELEIYADDVQCAHGSTAGALDDEALFYLRQRGLSESEARAILVEAFLGEVFDGDIRLNIAEAFRTALAAWLESGR